METVFGDVLEGFLEIGNTVCPVSFDGNHELLRCKKHKTIEGTYLLETPKNSSFLDIGANFGDTVLTMALHAKNNDRPDICFFAFEPNKIKCQVIEEVAERNGLKIKVYSCCVGNTAGCAISDGLRDDFNGGCSYKYDCDGGNGIQIMKLDSIESIITPIGIMHIDTEGWELEVLKGSHNLLNNKKNCFILVCECWPDETALEQKERGRAYDVMSATPKKDTLNLISKYDFERLEDIIDLDENLVFRINN